MTIDYAFSWVKDICRKHQFGEIQPDLFNKALSTAQDSFYDWLIGQLEQYKPGKPVPNVAVGMSQKISQWLIPLKTSNYPVNINSGIALSPPDFDYLVLMTDDNNKKIERIDDSKKPGRLNSKIDPITDGGNPFYTDYNANGNLGWEIYPDTTSGIRITYYSRPVDVVWNYTINANGRAVYTSAGSVDPVFDDVSMRKILARTIRLMGFSFTEPDWVEYGNQAKQGGE